MVDLFTRHIEVMPLRNQHAKTLVEAFEQGWVYRGHGVPRHILSDQGHNTDGDTFREFCRKLGVNKRRTSPYRPQADGMAERNIGMVKQVIRCLQQDRELPKGSWPALLTEVSFFCNGIPNSSTRVSPHMLTYGREPPSPLNAWCKELEEGEVNSHGEHLEALRSKQAELQAIAKENADKNLQKARNWYNRERVESRVVTGDFVFLKRQRRIDSLAPRFDGPYEVLARRNSNVKLKLPRRDKWIHLDRCKIFEGDLLRARLEPTLAESTEIRGEIEEPGDEEQSQVGAETPLLMEYPEEREPAEEMSIRLTKALQATRDVTQTGIGNLRSTSQTTWDGMGPQVTTVTPNKRNTSFREGVMLETRLYIEPSALVSRSLIRLELVTNFSFHTYLYLLFIRDYQTRNNSHRAVAEVCGPQSPSGGPYLRQLPNSIILYTKCLHKLWKI